MIQFKKPINFSSPSFGNSPFCLFVFFLRGSQKSLDQERSHMAHLSHSRLHQWFLAWRVALQSYNQTSRLHLLKMVLYSVFFMKILTLLELKQSFFGSLCSFLAARSVKGNITYISNLPAK